MDYTFVTIFAMDDMDCEMCDVILCATAARNDFQDLTECERLKLCK
jgi:hypothetical protein